MRAWMRAAWLLVTAACTTPSTGVCADLEADACERWMDTALPAPLPPARGNRVGDDERAAELGFALFFDTTALSAPGAGISCARCHSPERGFADRTPFSLGLGRTPRNAPALVDAARNYPHFWDGRADSLWSQPLQTIENETEMKGTRLGVAHAIAGSYRAPYEAVFGALPDLSDAARFPAQGKPGDPAWAAMSAADRDAIDRVYSNVGKALEAYERKLATGESDVDRFLRGAGDLSTGATRGLRVFADAGCFGCHGGPTFTDGRYHALDLPVPPLGQPDVGRAAAVDALRASEWSSLGPYYDRAPGEPDGLVEDTSDAHEPGAFLTPSLRNVGDTAPYGHNGAFATLDAVIRFHAAGGGPAAHDPALVAHALSDQDVADLVELMLALHGDTAPLPWSWWPRPPM